MIYDPIFQAIVGGSLVALGVGAGHMRIRFSVWRKRQRRKEFLGMGYRRDPEPVWGRWDASWGKVLKR